MTKPIYVTQPNLPPLDEFIPYLEQIWESRVLTNNGPFHQQLEKALCEYLGVEHISLFANGTAALMVAIQALQLTGEVITTPYSFVATTHALVWNGLTPVFVDIERESLNIDPKKIEAAITSRTTAIMPVHCYGRPCDVDAIKKISDDFNLKIIYDAAHAFGVACNGVSLLSHGNLSVLSFHATKVFNTFEGGAIVSPDANTKKKIDQLKNFGIVDELTVSEVGLNGKMSEICAAFGLLQLKHMGDALQRRSTITARYSSALNKIRGIHIVDTNTASLSNFSYFPILIGNDFPLDRDQLFAELRRHGINARRYFYPLISDFSTYTKYLSGAPENLPVAKDIANRVLCLPLYPALSDAEVDAVLSAIIEVCAV